MTRTVQRKVGTPLTTPRGERAITVGRWRVPVHGPCRHHTVHAYHHSSSAEGNGDPSAVGTAVASGLIGPKLESAGRHTGLPRFAATLVESQLWSGSRTRDRRITNTLLYPLSYPVVKGRQPFRGHRPSCVHDIRTGNAGRTGRAGHLPNPSRCEPPYRSMPIGVSWETTIHLAGCDNGTAESRTPSRTENKTPREAGLPGRSRINRKVGVPTFLFVVRSGQSMARIGFIRPQAGRLQTERRRAQAFVPGRA